MSIKLKACPFCGGEAKFHRFESPHNFYSVKCGGCGSGTDGYKLSTLVNTDAENKAANAAVWNWRVKEEWHTGNKSPKPKTIPQQLQEIADTICDKYCKHPERYGEDNADRMYDEVCDGCPLTAIL